MFYVLVSYIWPDVIVWVDDPKDSHASNPEGAHVKDSERHSTDPRPRVNAGWDCRWG